MPERPAQAQPAMPHTRTPHEATQASAAQQAREMAALREKIRDVEAHNVDLRAKVAAQERDLAEAQRLQRLTAAQLARFQDLYSRSLAHGPKRTPASGLETQGDLARMAELWAQRDQIISRAASAPSIAKEEP